MKSILSLAIVTSLVFVPVALANSTQKKVTADEEFKRVYRLNKMKALQPQALWKKLYKLRQSGQLSRKYLVPLEQLQASILLEAGYPVAASLIAASSLKKAPNASADSLKKSWDILSKVSSKRPIQYILENLASSVKLEGYPYRFGNDWNYIVGNAFAAKGFNDRASVFYKRVNMSSRYFMPSKYQLAMNKHENGDLKGAIASLKSIILSSTHSNSPLKNSDKEEMVNYAAMALGRIYYEKKKFLTSARYYRRVAKDSPLYYNALFEQSWSLFMSGNGRHSLGSLYGVSSPFFDHVDNPEAKLLESIVYYWMCRYDDSKQSLADFTDKYSKTVTSLTDYLEGRALNSKSAYELFENLVSGVSERSLGVPADVLTTAASRDTMILVRDQLATVMSENARLRDRGVSGTRKGTRFLVKVLDQIEDNLKNELGRTFTQELSMEKAHYEELYSQSQFLYLELLMSEKEQMLGRELHKGDKLAQADHNQIRGWGRETQSWKGGKKGEFWWDEIGFHIVDVPSKCID